MADELPTMTLAEVAAHNGMAKVYICWGSARCPHAVQPPVSPQCQVCYVVEANDPRSPDEIVRDMGRPQ